MSRTEIFRDDAANAAPRAFEQTATRAAEKTADTAAEALRGTRDAAEHSFAALERGVDGLRRTPAHLGQLAADVKELARDGLERARRAREDVQERALELGDRTVGYIRDAPVRSTLIAAAAGAGIAGRGGRQNQREIH
jgi:ElaB/YqjD/DUF883 family membrane-anchored ribosome-binding protein